LRRRTSFGLITYMTNWDGPLGNPPGYSPLFQAALGAAPLVFLGGTAAAGTTATGLVFESAHGLVPEQAVTHGGEMRFVAAVVDANTVQLNAPLSVVPQAGAPIGPTLTFLPANDLPSVSIFDYWLPETAVQRIVSGAAMDRMSIEVNGDFHQFEFSGPARDLIDSVSFTPGDGELAEFPGEPAPEVFSYSVIPGHLGQVWLGAGPERFLTVTGAAVTLENGIDLRAREFGSLAPHCFAAGRRRVAASFELFEQDDDATKGLYQAGREQSGIEVMLQLGQQAGQLFGARMKSVVPEVPEFEDLEGRLSWKFSESRAQGTVDDEIAVAFG
jgi:hypothetical protein